MRLETQQGDILIFEVDEIPKEAESIGDVQVLAEGEVTGHRHYLSSPVPGFRVGQSADTFMAVPKRIVLKHGNEMSAGDHGEHVLEPKKYLFRQVQVFNPFLKALERASD
jgi:hypothetical protein